MLITINKTVKKIEPVQVNIETPSYYMEFGKRIAILEDETIVEVFKYGTMFGFTIYEKDMNCLNYRSKIESIANAQASTEENFAEYLKAAIQRSKINELFK